MTPSARIKVLVCVAACLSVTQLACAQDDPGLRDPGLHEAAAKILELSTSADAADRVAGDGLLAQASRELLLEVNRLLLQRLRGEEQPEGLQILVEARVLELEPAFLEELGIELGGGDGSGQTTRILDEVELARLLAAVGEGRPVSLVSNPRLLVLDRQQASITVAEETSYVSDYVVEVKDGQTIADPVIDTLKDGFVLDLRPVLSEDGKFVTLDASWTLSELLRPIQELDTDVGGIRVTIQLPELTIRQIKSTATIPLDGPVTILIASPPDSKGTVHAITLSPTVIERE